MNQPNTQSKRKKYLNQSTKAHFHKDTHTYSCYTKWTNKRVTRGQCHRSGRLSSETAAVFAALTLCCSPPPPSSYSSSYSCWCSRSSWFRRCTRSLPTSSNLVQLRTAATPSTSYSFSSPLFAASSAETTPTPPPKPKPRALAERFRTLLRHHQHGSKTIILRFIIDRLIGWGALMKGSGFMIILTFSGTATGIWELSLKKKKRK